MLGKLKCVTDIALGFAAIAVVTVSVVFAQTRFEPVLQVGDTLITRYQVDERVRFLTLLNAPGDVRELAIEQLTVAAIQTNAATAAGIEVSDAELTNALDDFAGQADLSGAEFIDAIAQNGIGAETFRSFVSAGIVWRDYVRATFGDEARDLPDSLVTRRLARTGTEGGTRILLSEIVLPATTPETRAASLARANELRAITDETAFSAAARRFSIGPTRGSGGERAWLALDGLPDDIRPAVASLEPGQTSRPVPTENAILLFHMRDRETVAAGAPESLSVEYVLYLTDGGPTQAAVIQAQVDTCDDFYGVSTGSDTDRVIRETQVGSALPDDIRTATAELDPLETTLIKRGDATGIVMLCGRTIDTKSRIDLDLAGTALLNQKLSAIATHHLAELRAETVIRSFQN